MWFAVTGEVCLVLALGLGALRCWRFRHTATGQWPSLLLAGALVFIAINAAVGALRYAGVTAVLPLHQLLTAVSVALMMPLYVAAALWSWGRLSWQIWLLWLGLALLPGVSSALPALDVSGWPMVPRLLTDVMLVLGLLRIIQQAQARLTVIVALAALLAVPLSGLLPLSVDAGLGLFHILLALHFFAFYLAIPALAPSAVQARRH